jgi:spore photoproduct lyase
MFSTLYVERKARSSPLAQKIIQRFTEIPVIDVERYGEVFNRRQQNFRLQKRKPGLILARKHEGFVLPAPAGYGFGEGESFYFSHMLNCVYDCRYCFLQGMYRSAHYVLFVNFEDFQQHIAHHVERAETKQIYFYSGYDCDSLALEPISGFAKRFITSFKDLPNAWLELRTKSTQIRNLLDIQPVRNCVVAYSFSPQDVAEALEHKVPALEKRIDAATKLQRLGWPIGLRFEPLIYHEDYRKSYTQLFQQLFAKLDARKLHSVSIGLFRMPNDYFANIVKLYPDEKLFAAGLQKGKRLTSYAEEIEREMVSYCQEKLLEYVPETIYYRCAEN